MALAKRGFSVFALDGKTVKNVPKTLKPVRAAKGGVLGGKALVAQDLSRGFASALASSLDGHTNEASLVPDLLPQIRQQHTDILWISDR